MERVIASLKQLQLTADRETPRAPDNGKRHPSKSVTQLKKP